MLNNGELMTENQFKKSLPLEEQPGYNPEKDPNLLRRIQYYQGESLGEDFNRLIAELKINLSYRFKSFFVNKSIWYYFFF